MFRGTNTKLHASSRGFLRATVYRVGWRAQEVSIMTTYTYGSLFIRLLRAVHGKPPGLASVLGMHWERWARRQKGFGVKNDPI